MDAVALLESENREVERLLSRFEKTTKKRHKEMLLAALAEDLEIQASIEEHHFYPAIRAARGTEPIILAAIEEHRSIKRVLADLLRIDADDETFMAKIKVLRERIEHRVREEETDLFPRAKHLLDAEELEILGASMEAEQHRLANRKKPRDGSAVARELAL